MNIVGKIKRVQWKSRKSLTIIAILLTAIVLLRIKYYRYSTQTNLEKVKAAVAWEYVSDFSNMKHLNPAIVDFIILSDSGNFDSWRYTVQYQEVSSHWPYLTSDTIAFYEIKTINSPKQSYHIDSNHTSCTIFGSICLTTYSNFNFSQNKDVTTIFEIIDYQCPFIFSHLCRKEIEHQRSAIARNLVHHFSKPIKF